MVKYVPLHTHVNILLLGDQLDLPEDYVTVGSAHKKLKTGRGWQGAIAFISRHWTVWKDLRVGAVATCSGRLFHSAPVCEKYENFLLSVLQ